MAAVHSWLHAFSLTPFLYNACTSLFADYAHLVGRGYISTEPQLYSRVDLAVIVLGVHDDYQVGSHIHAPAETPRSHHHLDSP